MIDEIVLFALLAQMTLLCVLIWKLIQLDRKQQSLIFGISHVWDSVNRLVGQNKNKEAPAWNRSGPTGETDPTKMELPDAWHKRVEAISEEE